MIDLLLGGLVDAAVGQLTSSLLNGLVGGKARRDQSGSPPCPKACCAPALRAAPQGQASRPLRANDRPDVGPRLFLLPSTYVRSSTPGRLRLHVAGLQGRRSWAAALRQEIFALPYVERVLANEVTGNVLVCYAPADQESTVRTCVEMAIQQTDPRGKVERRGPTPALPVLGGARPTPSNGPPLSS